MSQPVQEKPYVYNDFLGDRDIRLITLLPGKADDPIALTIKHVSLEHLPPYEALSYVWGPQTPTFPVLCDSCNVHIGKSLFEALQQLRLKDQGRVLWIDRLAIDQDNAAERSRQVSLMADIFQKATRVVAWFGPADEGTRPAIDLMNDLCRQWLHLIETCPGDRRIVDHGISYPPAEDSRWAVIRTMFRHPWFFRIWTFQEIVLSREATLQVGSCTIQWVIVRSFVAGLKWFPAGPNLEDYVLGDAGREVELIHGIQAILVGIDKGIPRRDRPGSLCSLVSLLDKLRHRQATDPRDKVFALLNVALDARNSDLKPDYTLSLIEVYAVTVKWLIKRHRNLDFLRLVEKKDRSDLISWIPDFRYRGLLNFTHLTRTIDTSNEPLYYRASGTSKVTLKDESLFQLTLRGFQVGVITARTDPDNNVMDKVALGSHVLDEGQWHLFAREHALGGIYRLTGEPIDQAYHRIRIWDLLPDGNRPSRMSPPLIELPQPDPSFYTPGYLDMGRGPLNDIGSSILFFTTRKRLFCTDSGFLGIGHRSLEVGDRVYILMGAAMPVVLRPIGGKYFSFGGEAYVHGLMDGEALVVGYVKWGLFQEMKMDPSWVSKLGQEEQWRFEEEEIVLV